MVKSRVPAGTSDSIPAMLSDGEFVMTAKAVRGMGDGNKKGAAKMYQMMNKLEYGVMAKMDVIRRFKRSSWLLIRRSFRKDC